MINKKIENMKNKKLTVFIDLGMVLSEVINPIYTETKCGNKELIELKKKLNSVIYKYINADATVANCSMLWETLKYTYQQNQVTTTTNVEISFLNDVKQAIKNIGNSIAYMYPRKINKNTTFQVQKDMFILMHTSTDFETVKNAWYRSYLYSMSITSPDEGFEMLEEFNNLSEETINSIVNQMVKENVNKHGQNIIDEVMAAPNANSKIPEQRPTEIIEEKIVETDDYIIRYYKTNKTGMWQNEITRKEAV